MNSIQIIHLTHWGIYNLSYSLPFHTLTHSALALIFLPPYSFSLNPCVRKKYGICGLHVYGENFRKFSDVPGKIHEKIVLFGEPSPID